MLGRSRLSCLLLVCALLCTAPAAASVVVPVAEADLTAQAAAVVVGSVARLQSFVENDTIVTTVAIRVDDTLKGDPVTEVTLRQAGGTVGGRHLWIDGSPEFVRGEKVVVFLGQHADGVPRVLHLYQGKFTVVRDRATGDEYAYRDTPAGVRVLGRAPRSPGVVLRRLRDLADAVRAQERSDGPRRLRAPLASARAPLGTAVQETASFTMLGEPARWFQPDAGQAVRVLVNAAGEPAAPTGGFDQVRAGLAAWSSVTGSSFRYADGGVTTLRGFAFDGANVVSFRDPDGDIDPPVNCSGTVAQGGFYRSSTESRVVNGATFFRILEGDLVVADGWQGCGVYETFASLAEVVTHELGHVLGLGHSADASATMAAFAHFDGRGASLRADDIAGLRAVYPAPTLTVARTGGGSGMVTSSPGGVTCGTECAQPYPYGTVVTLTASPATGSVFTGWTGACAGTGTCRVTVTATTAVTAAFERSALTVGFTSPAAGATVSGTVTVSVAAGGGSGFTYRVALDGTPIYAGTSASFAWNTTAASSGTHTLTATVTDSLGRTGTATRSVTVANAGTSAPPPSSTGTLRVVLTQPRAGATVSGTQWVVMWVEGYTGAANVFTLTAAGQTVGTSTTASGGPVSMPWNSPTAPNGVVTLTASVRDAGGRTGATSLAVTVTNGTAPTTAASPLTASITAPAAGVTVSGTSVVAMSAAGGAPPYTYRLSIDGAIVFMQTTSSSSASWGWNTTASANGSHALSLAVTDAAGGTATAVRTVEVSNSSDPPPVQGGLRVVITQPRAGAVVSGTVWAVVWVEGAAAGGKTYTLAVDGAVVSTQTTTSSGPVSMPWSTATGPNGARTIRATVGDATGASGASTVSVTVAN